MSIIDKHSFGKQTDQHATGNLKIDNYSQWTFRKYISGKWGIFNMD